MPLRCADCNHKMLLSPDGATASIACERCGGKRLERDQPSPTHSDGDLRNMVDPGGGVDQGGNPNMEGIWANNGWQPYNRRDESYASVRTAMDFGDFDFESEPRTPSHHVIVTQRGNVYSGVFPEHHEDIADRNRIDEHDFVNAVSKGAVYPEGDTHWYTHASGHSPQAMEQMLHGHFGYPISVDPDLQAQSENQRWGIEPGAQGNGRRELEVLEGPANPRSYGVPHDREGLVRGGSLDMEAHLSHFPFHVAEVPVEAPTAVEEAAPVGPQYHQEGVLPGSAPAAERLADGGNLGIHAGTTRWLGFLDAHVNGEPVRGNEQNIIRQYAGKEDPVTVSVHHPDHLPGAVAVIEHSSTGSRPAPAMIEVGRAIQRGQMAPPPGVNESTFKKRTHIAKTYGIPHLAFLPALLGLGVGVEGLAGAAAPFLMRGALMGAGSNMIQGLMGGGGNEGMNPQVMPAEERDVGVLGRVADMETPHTNPGFHDDPDGDPHQFKDQSHDPNPENPNLNGEAGGSQLGEDNVQGGFGPNSRAMEKFNLLFPAVLHHYHSEQSGAHDPMIRELHEQMDRENPGYLDRVDDEQGAAAVQHLIEQLRDPGGVHAKVGAPVYQTTPMAPGQMMMGPQQMTLPQQQQQPGILHPEQVGNCQYCGGTVTADGTCPQCGAKNGPFGAQPGGIPSPTATPPAGPGTGPNPIMPFVGKVAGDTQGPVSKEQQAAVAQLLIDTNRHDEIPTMLQRPELYADELAQVTQNDQTQPPPVDPNQTPPPQPPMDPSQMGQMPVPGMSVPPGAGGSPSPYTGKIATPHPGAPRCPNCNSATTGFLKDDGTSDTDGICHSCGKVWDLPDAKGVRTSDYENPVATPAADQQKAYDPSQDQDSSMTWVDADGDPIIEGQEYELFTSQYPIPDRVRIDQKKPDEIVYSTIGEFDPNPQDASGTLEYQNRISREEFQMQKYQFKKADGQDSDAGDQTLDQYADTSQAPQFTEPVGQPGIQPRGSWTPEGRVAIHKHSPMSEYDKHFGGEAGAAEKAKAAMKKQYGDEKGEEVFYATVNKKKSGDITTGKKPTDSFCPKCASEHISSSMSSPTTTFHECYRCAHGWETKEEGFETDGSQGRAWLMTGSGPAEDDFWQGYERAQKMGDAGGGSRSLAAAAARDPRLREISERLDGNRMAREAGKRFTPYEQRNFIDERGTARNADKLDLTGTHYESHRYLGDKANGANVPDAELFLGI